MAAAVRGGDVTGVIFHSDKGGEYTGDRLRPGVQRARGDPVDGPSRLGAGQRRRGELQLDPRTRTAVPAPLRHQSRSPPGGRRFIDAYNHRRRHSSCEMLPPVAYEQLLVARQERAA